VARGVTLPKPFWTTGKIVGLVLALILGTGAFGYVIIQYSNGRAPSSHSANVCTNGATNYPTCNNNDHSANSCTNGATNYPTCNNNVCQYGGSFPNCNPAPSCQYGGTYPNCSPLTPQCKGTAACFTDTVEYIVDGDTLDVGSTRIRLALVNTPEVGQPGYAEAKQFTAQLCLVGSQALVDEDDGQTSGSYGRMVAVVYCGGANLNAELLRSGFAVLVTYYCGVSEFAKESWTGCP